MTLRQIIQDALARIVAATESIGYGGYDEAIQLLQDLEIDLYGVLQRRFEDEELAA